MTDIAKVAASLSKAQALALTHAKAGGCSYGWAPIRTCEALYSRRLVSRHSEFGSMFSPQTNIKWPLTPFGLAVRAYLNGEAK